MFRITAIFLLLLQFQPAKGQVKDTVFLYDGQVLIGNIQNIAQGILTIDDMDLKEISIKLFRIKRLTTDKKYKVQIDSKLIYYGVFTPGDTDGLVCLHTESGLDTCISVIRLFVVLPLEKKFLQNLDGDISAGFSYTKSSSVGQYNMSATVSYASRKFNYQLTASSNASIDSSSFSRDREELGLMAGYYITPKWFAASNSYYQRNLELSISRRLQETVGAGGKLFVHQNWYLLSITGISFNQERSTAGDNSGLLLEIPCMFRFNFFQFHHPNISINSNQSLYFGLTEKGRVRYEGNTNISWQLIRYFYIKLNPYTNFDNQPPSGGNNFDFGVVLSVSYKF